MKKLFAILMTICLLAGMLCITAFAESTSGALNTTGSGHRRFGSIFGEGSLTMIIVLSAIIVCGAAVFFIVYRKKKKAAASQEEDKETQAEGKAEEQEPQDAE